MIFLIFVFVFFIIFVGYGKVVCFKVGQVVCVVNMYGIQVVDCWVWNVYDLVEYMCMEIMCVWNQCLNFIVGDSFVINQCYFILMVVEDVIFGVYDIFMVVCDCWCYELFGVKYYYCNCCDNMFEGMFELGVMLLCFNLVLFNIFMNICVQFDGIMLKILLMVIKLGDFIIMCVEMDCFVVFFVCLQDIVKIQGQGDNIFKLVEIMVLEDFYFDLLGMYIWVLQN